MNHRSRVGTTDPEEGRGTHSNLLGIYLNDHLAGATAGVERARHVVRSCRGTAVAAAMDPIATEIAQDRESLLNLMQRLNIPSRQYKIYAGWAAEKVSRLKGNGRLVRRSPLSSLIELELLRLGVAGKAAGWEVLRRLCDREERLDPQMLDDLLERAHRQLRVLEELHLQQVAASFRTQNRSSSGAR